MPTVNNVRQFGPELLTLTHTSMKHFKQAVWYGGLKQGAAFCFKACIQHRPISYYDVSEHIKACFIRWTFSSKLVHTS